MSQKQGINLFCEGTLPIVGGLELCLSPDTGNLRPRILYKQDLSLIQQFTTLRPNSFVFSVLLKFIVSLSKRYKGFLLWSFLWVSYFYGAPIYTYKIKFVFSFSILCQIDYSTSQRNQEKNGEIFPPLHWYPWQSVISLRRSWINNGNGSPKRKGFVTNIQCKGRLWRADGRSKFSVFVVFLAVCMWNCEILRCQGWGISSSCPLCLALKSVYEKEKRCTSGSCKLNFTWGKMRSAVWETAPQIALRDCSKEAVGEGQYMDFGEGEVHITKHLFHTRSSAGHEELMSAWRDLVLF